jgi:hypothetical protein
MGGRNYGHPGLRALDKMLLRNGEEKVRKGEGKVRKRFERRRSRPKYRTGACRRGIAGHFGCSYTRLTKPADNSKELEL